MRISVLINNYNYERYLSQCVSSVLEQTRKADEVVIVDDGSTDGSAALIRTIAETSGTPVKFVEKANGGQLSAFNSGVGIITSDIVCFLDSDDLFDLHYLENVERGFSAHPECDVFYSSYVKIFPGDKKMEIVMPDEELPLQLLETAFLFKYCGGPTSTISIRHEALARILPYDDEASWRVSADDVLVMKSAGLMMNRRCSSSPLVLYRIHGSNNYHGRSFRRSAKKRRAQARAKLLQPIRSRLDSLSQAELVSIYQTELASSRRTPVSIYRFFRLVFAMPVAPRARFNLFTSFVGWLSPWGRR